MTSVSVRNLEKCTTRKSGDDWQADDVLVKLLHGIQIVDAKRDLAKAAHYRAFLIRGQSWQMHLPTVRRRNPKSVVSDVQADNVILNGQPYNLVRYWNRRCTYTGRAA